VVPKPRPVTFREDFERGARSPWFALTTLDQEGRQDLITVTDAVSASGKHSLKVQDRADLKAAFNPHFYWDPHYSEGSAELAFRIRLEPGADVICEWRDASHPYRTGPSLRFRDKTLSARGAKLAEIPDHTWIAVRMRARVGQPEKGWNLTVEWPGSQPHQIDRLPCDPTWKEVRWVGFSSQGTRPTVFYLDDIEMARRDQ
jgi:hypothetical protein